MEKVSFSNTEIAFQSKTTFELKKARVLFKVVANPNIVKTANVLLQSALKIRFPIKWAVKPTIYSHFVGGETISDCSKTVKHLAKFKVKSILDYSVEGKESDVEIEEAMRETLASVRNAAENPDIPFAVFKPTAFGKSSVLEKASLKEELSAEESQELQKFKKRIDLLCKTAYDLKLSLLIDAEDSWFQHLFDEVIREMMQKYNKEKAIVYNTLQMYRWDRLEFLKEETKLARKNNYFFGAKFVRGAYMEKERERASLLGYKDPIQVDKEHTDRDYNAALEFSLQNIDRVSVFNGSHNEFSNRYLTDLMETYGIDKEDPRVYFSQLYGMSDHISFNLANAGYNVAKYVPYGPVNNVLPYLIRRAEENTSVKGQTGRELSLILQEIKRREGKK